MVDMMKLYFFIALALTVFTHQAHALPPDGMVYKLKSAVVKVRVILPNGHYGVGSGVAIAKDQIVTNCHVVANASAINVIKFGESHRASSIKADWQHDLCIVGFDGLNVGIAEIGSSKNLQYEQPVFTISFPNNAPKPLTTYGFVKALYPMDDSVVIRSDNDFRMGASGGAMFDEQGKLVGIITLKSPGRNAFYYNMPVEWISALLAQPAIEIPAKGGLPFWDAPEDKRPFFMRVIQPYQTEDWANLHTIASNWCEKEPHAIEAYYYRGLAAYHLKNFSHAHDDFDKVIAENARHVGAQLHLGLLAAHMGKKDEALKKVAVLTPLDESAVLQINMALGIESKPAEAPSQQ